MAKIQALGASSRPTTNRCSHRVLEPFASEVERLLSASLAVNTVKLYNQAVSKFDALRAQYNFNRSWPPSIDDIVNFIAYLSSEGYSFSSAKTYLSGTSFYTKLNDGTDPFDVCVVKKMLKGFQRLNPTKDSRAPVTLQMLKGFPLALKNVTVSKYEALLFSTAFSIAFFGFLRIGEMIACGKSSDNSHLIHNTDVAIYEQNVEITLRFSKTDQLGKSAKLLFYPSQEAHICPVSLTKQFLKVRPKVQGPLFCHFDGQPVTRYQFSSILNKVVKFIGSPLSQGIKCHSFRIGAATLATAQCVADSDIKSMGRWSEQSTSYSRYIHLDKIKT